MFKNVVLSELLNPVSIFFGVWIIQISLYLFDIAYFLPVALDDILVLLRIFLVSLVCFLIGVISAVLVLSNDMIKRSSKGRLFMLHMATSVEVPSTRLRWAFLMLAIVIITISIMNWYTYGPLPLLSSLLGVETPYNYLDYGRSKYIVFGATLLLISLTYFERSKIIRLLTLLFSFCILSIYVTRYFIIHALLQYLFLHIFVKRPKVSFSKLGIGIFIFVIITATVMTIIGDVRTGSLKFLEAMQIKEEFRWLPIGILWLISYIAFPLANIITLVGHPFNNFYGGLFILNDIVPPFLWNILGVGDATWKYVEIVYNYFPNPLNNVATYLGHVFLDFGFLGIILFNFFLGFSSWWVYVYAKQKASLFARLIGAIWLSNLTLIFFSNLFLNVTILTEIVLIGFASLFLRARIRRHPN